MTQAQIISGTGAELLPVIERLQDRVGLTLIVPADAGDTPSVDDADASVAAASDRLRSHIVHLPTAPELDNDSIDTDLAREYRGVSPTF